MNKSLLLDVTDTSSIPRRLNRRCRWWRRKGRNARCPYCLEFFGSTEDEGLNDRVCGICAHFVPESLQTTKLHLFGPGQVWAHFVNELEHIWYWERNLLKSYQHLMCGYRSEVYSEAKAEFEELSEARYLIACNPEEFLHYPGGPDLGAIGMLKKYGGGGNLARDLEAGRPFREEAVQLSSRGNPPGEITEFQWDLVRATSWGAYGFWGFNEKPQVLKLLEARMGRRDAGCA